MKSIVILLLSIVCLNLISEMNLNSLRVNRLASKGNNKAAKNKPQTNNKDKKNQKGGVKKKPNSDKASSKKLKNNFDEEGDDESYTRIRSIIQELAVVSMAKSNLNIKKKLVGSLSDQYPKNIRDMAREKHYDKSIWRQVMALPTKIFKFCIFPTYQLNYYNWCYEKYSTKSQQKLVNCRNTFCQVCCDNLQIMLKNQADNNVIGELLYLSKASGYKKIQQAATLQEIHQCKKECNINYPVAFPKPPLPVPRDPKLGKWAETPAKSCADIKRWGVENADSGSYWIDLGKKGITQVYCDMYSLNGGWTLFFNYMKMPNAEVQIKEGRLPNDLKKNTHMNLKNAGFSEDDVQELRFFCTEKSHSKIFWHFKSDSPQLINTAFNGDQRKVDLGEFKSTYTELQFPGKAVLWQKAMDQFGMQDSLDFVNTNNASGSFWDRPFGSKSEGKFWTVKGSNKNSQVFECGTKHKSAVESSTAYTHHTVWFRGLPPSEDFARTRYYNKEIKRLQNETMKAKEEQKKNKK